MRRLIVCCDGTWNHPDQKGRNDSPNKPSNIVKIQRSILPVDSNNISQITYYHKGVGTGNVLDKITGGVIGKGLDDNIINCYRFLANNYHPGDEVFIFGFSRGAYTARSLIGLIDTVGLLPKRNIYYTPDAYDIYRNKGEGKEAFVDKHQSAQIKISFVGVFDTVGAMGVPLKIFRKFNSKKYGFHSHELPDCVINAFHALAIDELRKPFKPTLWDEDIKPFQTMEQRWFTGVHTNVGGGYQKDGLANISLHWILHHAIKSGLQIDYDFIKFYKPFYGHNLYNSLSFGYKLLGKNLRTIKLTPLQRIDESVQSRIKGDYDYKPKNVGVDSEFADSIFLKKPAE